MPEELVKEGYDKVECGHLEKEDCENEKRCKWHKGEKVKFCVEEGAQFDS